jgi:hypothetical protein
MGNILSRLPNITFRVVSNCACGSKCCDIVKKNNAEYSESLSQKVELK